MSRLDSDLFLKHLSAASTVEVVLRGQLWLESQISEAIAVNPRVSRPDLLELDRLSFSAKTAFAVALGSLHPDVQPSLLEINRTRNRLAHTLEYEVTQEDLDRFIRSFPPWLRPAADSIAKKTSSTIATVMPQLIALLAFTVEKQIQRLHEEQRQWLEVHKRMSALGLKETPHSAT